ncbi:flagellar assembly protein FliH [Shewanella donghaensis]|uniref:flagellar assembly protein FliH n=1 Tax=Shewanella donghaensis TaxID=238836 RepID=UPI001182CDBF|nr:flagellar assembly protein FliH [Shewanella donghaensis]
MTESKTNKSNEIDDSVDFSHWQLPDVTQQKNDVESNLFGQLGRDNPQPILDEQPLLPPTMAEIEQIRAEAEQEGLAQGQAEGHGKGLEQGRLEGLEQGHAEGFAQGEQQGYDVGLTKANDMLERLSALVQQFEQPLMVLDAELEAELLQLSINLAKSIVGNELQTHPEHILSVLRQGVDSLPIKKQQVTLRFCPDDATLVYQLYSDSQLEKNKWEIEADPSLKVGDCIIQSERSNVDLRVEERMKQTFTELQQQVAGINANVQTVKSESNQYTTKIVDEFSVRNSELSAETVADETFATEAVTTEAVTTETLATETLSAETEVHPETQATEISEPQIASNQAEIIHNEPSQLGEVDDAKPSTSITE